jgi:hypothetical protein
MIDQVGGASGSRSTASMLITIEMSTSMSTRKASPALSIPHHGKVNASKPGQTSTKKVTDACHG